MSHLAYAGALAFCLAATLPLHRLLGLQVLTAPRRLLATLALAAGPFLVWDALATAAGQWHFDPDQVIPVRVAGLPLEEIAFFVVIPLAALITYEAVGEIQRRRRR